MSTRTREREMWAVDCALTALTYLERGNQREANYHLRRVGRSFDRQTPVPNAYLKATEAPSGAPPKENEK